ncbi:transcription factor RADIALIS-like isoform X2 [Andrographis paniculata]|uniref:transcription factor RADIALIS-like isoform X2 n=1 Tax=Andrographis paniculata TaxID=175694 RepID=UPI0021E82396|nr:transcription factor RADIALIS-like isoform X2 [Andrographis paniculata]
MAESSWSWNENKQFEDALSEVSDRGSERWGKIAAKVQTKSPEEIVMHHLRLVEDLIAIDAGLIEFPQYRDEEAFELRSSGDAAAQPRKAAKAWTDDEHK